MLQLLLQQSGRILCPPEPWIALPICGMIGGLESSALFSTHDGPNALVQFFRRTTYGTPKNFARDSLLRAYGALIGRDERLVLDKTPPYHRILPMLEQLFPEAKFIILRRHPLAVIHSCAHRWHGGDLKSAIRERFDDLVLAPQRLARLSPIPDRRHIVRYESLVADPQKELTALCDFLEMPVFESMGHYRPNHDQSDVLPGDTFSTPSHTRPLPDLADDWRRSPHYDALLQVARQLFPSNYWPTAGYVMPDPQNRPILDLPKLTTLDLRVRDVLEINSYGSSYKAPSFPSNWCFTPHDERDHIATKLYKLPADQGSRFLIDLDLNIDCQFNRVPTESGIVQIQNEKFETLLQAEWPLNILGLCVPVIRNSGLQSLRFVFSGKVGTSVPLPTAIGIQAC